MAVTITINGTDRSSYVNIAGLRFNMGYRSTWTADFDCADSDSTSSAFRPSLNQTVVIADGATTVFRGWIFGLRDEPVAPPAKGTLVRVTCRDYGALLDAVIVDKVYGSDPVGIANSSVANPTSITTVQPHGLTTGDRVVIADHVGSTAGVNGTHAVTVTSHSTFTVAINNTTSGGGGTVRTIIAADLVVADLHSTYLNSRGVSLDTLSTGADLEKQVYQGVTLRSVFDHLATITGWVLRITPDPELQFFEVGDKAASYSLTAANDLNVGAVTWEHQRQRFVNDVVLRYGSDAVVPKQQTITLDGSTNAWVLDYTPVLSVDKFIVSAGYVNENASTNYPLAPLVDIVSSSVANPTTITCLYPHGLDETTTHTIIIQSHTGSTPSLSGGYTATVTGKYTFTIPVNVTVAGSGGQMYPSGFTWLYYVTSNALFRVGAGTSEQIALLDYSAQFPQTVTAEDSASIASVGRWTGQYEAPEIQDVRAATQVADGILRRELDTPKSVVTSTRQGFVMPGDVITLTFTDRTVSGSFLIQSVNVTADGDKTLRYQIQGVDGEEFKDTALDLTRDALNGGGLRAAGGTITGTIVPSAAGMSTANVVAQSGSSTAQVEMGAVSFGASTSLVTGLKFTNGDNEWLMGARPAQSPGSAGYEFLWMVRNLSTLYPALRFVQDGTNLIIALNATFTGTVRGVQLGENASGKRFDSIHALEYYNSGGAAMGHWTYQAFSAGDFTASSGSWTVDSIDVTHLSYTVVGRTMTVIFFIQNTDVSATPTDLRITIPGGYTAACNTRNCISTVDAGGTPQFGMVLSVASDTKLYLYRDATGTTTWSSTSGDNTTVVGQITFEVV